MSGLIQKKMCILGDFAVGKTSLIRRFVDGLFDEEYLCTIGVSISRKVVKISDDRLVSLIIWDLAGGEKFTGVQTSYLQGASCAFLVGDLTRPQTFNALPELNQRLKKINPAAVSIMIGNKYDLVDEYVIQDASIPLKAIARETKTSYFLTSAKSNLGVDSAFQTMVKHLWDSHNNQK